MLRQYHPQRFRYQTIRAGNRERVLPVGTIPVGTIFRATNVDSRRTRPLIVEAWHPREIGAGRVVDGRYASSYVANGGHLATVRDLANGRRFKLSDHFIRFAVDHD